MIYTTKDLKDLLKSPIDSSKWGQDTHRVISIIRTISDASCSSCAMKRYLRTLKDILNKYGDDVTYTPNSHSVVRPNNTRIPCVDCVAKHLSQAYVLQGEFYQGYTEYLPLIEAHLTEALEECPPYDKDLRKSIKDMISSVVIDRKPDIYPVVYEEHNENAPKPHNINDDVVEVPDTHDITEESFYPVPTSVLDRVYRMLDTYLSSADAVDNEISRGHLPVIRTMGALAQTAEHISMYVPDVSVKLRDMRLKANRAIAQKDLDAVKILLYKCHNIKYLIKCAIDKKNGLK